MAKTQMPVAGAYVGTIHMPQAMVLSGGRSEHPLQRAGMAAPSNYPSIGATPLAGIGHAPMAAYGVAPLLYPATLSPSLAAHPAVSP